jgi:hypothetical protein
MKTKKETLQSVGQAGSTRTQQKKSPVKSNNQVQNLIVDTDFDKQQKESFQKYKKGCSKVLNNEFPKNHISQRTLSLSLYPPDFRAAKLTHFLKNTICKQKIKFSYI